MENSNDEIFKTGQSAGIRIYSLVVLIVDVVIVLLKFIGEIFRSMVNLFIKPELKDLSKEIVLITGAGHGIGKELALQYVQFGCKIVCLDINEKTNETTVKEANQMSNGKAFGYKCDVTNHEEVLELANKIKSEVGNISVIVNNAGIMPCHMLQQHTVEEIRRIFEINVFSHFWMLQAFLPHMIENGSGHIIAMSSMAGIVGLSNLVPYCSSKFAVRGLMEALQEEIREDPRQLKIKTTSIYPYMVDTGLCKKPRIRFPGLLGMLNPKDAAKSIIQAHRSDLREATIPRHLFYLNNIFRVLPYNCGPILKDFMDSGVESDL